MKNSNNQLTEEIDRIRELINKKLITEGIYIDLVTDITTKLGKILGKYGDDVSILVSKLKKAVTDDEVVSILNQLSKKSKEISDIIIPKIMNTLSDAESASIDRIKKHAKNLFDQKKSIEDIKKTIDVIVDKHVVTKFDDVKNIIKKDINDYVDSLSKQKPKPNIDDIKTIESVTAQRLDDLKGLSDEELEIIKKKYNEQGFKNKFMSVYYKFIDDFTKRMTNEVELMNDLLNTLKTLDESKGGSTTVINGLLEDIGNKVKNLTQSTSKNFNDVNLWVDNNILDYSLRNRIKSTDGWQMGMSIMDGKSLEGWKKVYGTLSENRIKCLKQLNQVFNPFTWIGKSVNKGDKWKKIFSSEYSQFWSWVLTGQPLSPNALIEYRNLFGWLSSIKLVGGSWFRSYVVLSIAYGVFDWFTDWLSSVLVNIPYLDKINIIKQQSDEWEKNSDLNDDERSLTEQGFLDNLGLLSYVWDSLKDRRVAIPSLIDDYFYFMAWLPQYAKSTKDGAKKQVEVVQRKAEETKNNIKRKIDNVVEQSKKETILPPSSSKYPTKEKFIEFLKTKTKTLSTYDQNTGVGTDTEGTEYYYDEDMKTFDVI